MVMAAMLIDALHAALDDREEAFDSVGVAPVCPASPQSVGDRASLRYGLSRNVFIFPYPPAP